VRKYEWNRYMESGNMQTNANKWGVCYHLFYLNSKDVKFRSFWILIIVKNNVINMIYLGSWEDEDVFYNYHMHNLNVLKVFFLLLWSFFIFCCKLWNGSKPITRSQRNYFGKGLHVFFPRNNLHANEFLNEFFCNLFFFIFKCPSMHQYFLLFIIE